MLDITAFMDESGHPSDPQSKMFGIAACYAPAKIWKALERQWMRALAEAQIDYFHSSDCAVGGGAFRSWEKAKRLRLYKKFASTMSRHKLTYVSCVIDMRAYRSIKGFDLVMENPYQMAFVACLQAMSYEANKQELPLSEKIACVVEWHNEYKAVAEATYLALANATPFLGRFVGAATFARKDEFVPFQVADLAAYEFNKFFLHRIYEPDREPRKSLLKMMKIRVGGRRIGKVHAGCYFYNEAHLRTMKTRMDAFDRSLSTPSRFSQD